MDSNTASETVDAGPSPRTELTAAGTLVLCVSSLIGILSSGYLIVVGVPSPFGDGRIHFLPFSLVAAAIPGIITYSVLTIALGAVGVKTTRAVDDPGE